MKPLPGVRLTVVCRELLTPYSGMLPGHVAGLYPEAALHIDLGRLAAFANARLVAGEIVGLDLDARRRLSVADVMASLDAGLSLADAGDFALVATNSRLPQPGDNKRNT